MAYTLNDFFLGEPDGTKEATYKQNFEDYFYDYNDIYSDAMNDKNFLILGRKGTGKSILGEFIQKKASTDPNWICKICSYKEFNFHELVQFQNNDVKPNEYKSIWEWVILIEFAKLCILDNSIIHLEERNKLDVFLKENFYSIDLDVKKIVEVTKQNKITGGLPKFVTGEHSGSTKYTFGSYLNYIEGLRNVVLRLLSVSENRYTLIFDELDDKFRNDEVYKNILISLLKTADKINLDLYRLMAKSKITILLRTDIFSILIDSDINKIKQANTIEIDWGVRNDKGSPLFDLVLTKIKKSVHELENLSRDELYSKLFATETKYRLTLDKYILSRTYLRPRDIITYLNFVIKKFRSSNKFNSDYFYSVDGLFSTYLWRETKDELFGHLTEKEIETTYSLLKQFKEQEFSYNEISNFYKEKKVLFGELDMEKILNSLFKAGALGNKWINRRYSHKSYYSWSYREDSPEIDFDKVFVVHSGLRKEFKLW